MNALRAGQPARFAMPHRAGWFIAAVWAFLVVQALAGSGEDSPWESRWTMIVLSVAAIVWLARWLWLGGSVTIDPASMQIERRRPGARRPVAAWGFGEITRITVRDGFRVDVVRLEFGSRHLAFEVPRGDGAALEPALRQAIARAG